MVVDQNDKEINEGDILLDSRGRTYTVVETFPTILAQGIVSGRQRNYRMGYFAPEYVRAYHCFVVPEHVSVEDGKALHRKLLEVGAADRQRDMRARHRSTDQLLRDRGIRS